MMTSKYGNGFTNYFLTNDGIQKIVELSESISSIYNNEGNSFTKTLTSDTIIGEKSIKFF